MRSPIGAWSKARETEEAVDLWFFRPLGYQIARLGQSLRVHPNAVTLASGLIGAVGAHFFFYQSWSANLLGIALYLLADLLDSADGQLARMTGKTTRWGRILDGVADTARLTSAYVHLALRGSVATGNWVWWFGAAVASGWSCKLQSAVTEYYRTAFIRICVSPEPIERSWWVRRELEALRRAGGKFFERLLLFLYLPYLRDVERVSPNFVSLLGKLEEAPAGPPPAGLAREYRRLNEPLLKYYSLLGTNLRSAVLFVCILTDHIGVFFLFEIVVLNAVAVALVRRQERHSAALLAWQRESENQSLRG